MLGSFDTQVEELGQAKQLAAGYPKILSAITDLEKLGTYLKLYGIEKYISFEPGIISNYHYYTGIIFAGYTFGTGEPVVKGGRYDKLLNSFGKNAPSIGFAIVVDQLQAALSRQRISLSVEENRTLLVYQEEQIAQAITRAQKLRAEGSLVSMIPAGEGRTREDFISYAVKNHIANVVFMDDEEA
jgi:ATP phosphoribosyltransferase regulatory subunit